MAAVIVTIVALGLVAYLLLRAMRDMKDASTTQLSELRRRPRPSWTSATRRSTAGSSA